MLKALQSLPLFILSYTNIQNKVNGTVLTPDVCLTEKKSKSNCKNYSNNIRKEYFIEV